MTVQKVGIKPLHGKMVSLTTVGHIDAQSLFEKSVKKMRDFNRDLDEGPFIFLYPDGSEVINTPVTERPFILGI